MTSRKQKIKELTELGYETKIENGTLFIFLDDYENDRPKIHKMFEGYNHSYGIRPKEQNGKEKEEKE